MQATEPRSASSGCQLALLAAGDGEKRKFRATRLGLTIVHSHVGRRPLRQRLRHGVLMLRALAPDVVALLATQHGVATAAQLRAAGMTPRQCRLAVHRGLLWRPYRGVYLDAAAWRAASDPVRHAMQLLGAQLVARQAVGIDVTAAIAWQLPVRAIPSRVAVARDASAGRLLDAEVRRAPVAVADTARVDDLLVTTLPVTCAAIAASHTLADALITLDAALRRGVRADEVVAAIEGFAVRHTPRAGTASDRAGRPRGPSRGSNRCLAGGGSRRGYPCRCATSRCWRARARLASTSCGPR